MREPSEFDEAFAAMGQSCADALLILPLILGHLVQEGRHTPHQRLPHDERQPATSLPKSQGCKALPRSMGQMAAGRVAV
jgi:hypothetical protein